MAGSAPSSRPNIEKPRYDQSNFYGRARHFFITTNPLNILATDAQLNAARETVLSYRAGKDMSHKSDDEIWSAKHLYDSAFHPDTGEKMFLLGRMSAQVPMNMAITGCMMTFYRTTPTVIFWQWLNQTFNALVNYTNRSGDSPIPLSQLGLSYMAATGGALVTALGLNRTVTKFPPLIGRFVPFAAVAAANCINIPCMRSRELTNGIPVFDEHGVRLGTSTVAATTAISQVVISRIVMASPGMLIPPFIMQRLERGALLRRMPWLNAPIQVGLVGLFLVFATPLCCALFPQQSSLPLSKIENADVKRRAAELGYKVDRVYFNKGL